MTPDDLGRRLVEEMPDVIADADADGVIGFWNAGAKRIFGFSREEAAARSLDLIIPADLRERHRVGYKRTMRAGHSRYGAGDLLSPPAIRKDGRRIAVQFSILPLPDAGRRLSGVAAAMRDVTADFEEPGRLKRALGVSGPAAQGARSPRSARLARTGSHFGRLAARKDS